MSCPRDLTSTISNTIKNSSYVGYNSSISNNMAMTNNNRAQYNNNLKKNSLIYKISNCRKISNKYPRFTPVIFSLSMNTSVKNKYSVVYINGTNFLPVSIGSTYVNFGTYTNLPIIYFSSSCISFTIPLNAKVGNYPVVVVSVYNGNFSPQVNNTYAGNLNISNSVNYSIT